MRDAGHARRGGGLAPARPALAFATALVLGGCTGAPSVLDARGPKAARTAELWWLMLGVAAVVFAVVVMLLLVALVRARAGRPADAPAEADLLAAAGGNRFVVFGGVVAPAFVLVGLMALIVRTMVVLSAPATAADLAVAVVGHQFWWEVRYPAQQVVTANEIHVPAGRPVQLNVTSSDVIHSFWVPQLMGKVDLVPGRTNSTWLQADQPGVYRGQCAEYCGLQHAHMAFLVVAEPPEQFAAWLDAQRQPAAEPAGPLARQGAQAFARERCITCHTIRYGATAVGGKVGPDLTHLASRRTIAGGMLENTRGNLGGWIANPQALKPGSDMPALPLDAQSLGALVAYLETLK
jgi:cytochrome c oxidase subunit II